MNEKEKRHNLKVKLHIMINKVNKMSNSKEKSILLYQIKSLASFLYYAEIIRLHEYII